MKLPVNPDPATLPELMVVVPSRGRPQAVRELSEAFGATCRARTTLVVAVDEDDVTVMDYPDTAGCDYRLHVWPGGSNMVRTLNQEARALAHNNWAPFALGFMGDDHRPRTVGWDRAYLDALHELGTGIVYGNDLLQGQRLPTQAAMTTDVVRLLDKMAPECLTHLFVDNYWRDLGQGADCLRYLPDVTVEHLHPIAGKAEWDAGYRRVNGTTRHRADRQAWFDYKANVLPKDIDTICRWRAGLVSR